MRCLGVMTLCLTLSAAGCVNLRAHEKQVLREIDRVGLNQTEIQLKDPLLAGFLGIVAPVCNWYLAYGTNESDQVMIGFLNLLLWAPSMLWAIPQCAVDAGTINKIQTVDYYLNDPRGQAEIAAARERYVRNVGIGSGRSETED